MTTRTQANDIAELLPEFKVMLQATYRSPATIAAYMAGERKDDASQAQAEAIRMQRHALLDAGYELYEYRSVPIRQTLIGDRIDTDTVDRTINDWAAQGWRLKSMTATSVAGRVVGGTEGLILVFERRFLNA